MWSDGYLWSDSVDDVDPLMDIEPNSVDLDDDPNNP
jgi:hypothetical protein